MFLLNMKLLKDKNHITVSWLVKGTLDRCDKKETPKEVQDSCKILLANFERRQHTNRVDSEGNFNVWNQEVMRAACDRQSVSHPFFAYSTHLDQRFKHLNTPFTGAHVDEKNIWNKILTLMVECKVSTITTASENNDNNNKK